MTNVLISDEVKCQSIFSVKEKSSKTIENRFHQKQEISINTIMHE